MVGTPIYDLLADRYLWHDPSTEEIPLPDLEENPTAETAGEDDHSDPWMFAGDDVDAPTPGEVPDELA